MCLSLKILFIGNSLTSANCLPEMLKRLAESCGNQVQVKMTSLSGGRLQQFAADPKTDHIIGGDKWNYVVLQEQGQLLAFSFKQVELDVKPYAAELCQKIKTAWPDSRPVFYMTMARCNGDQQNKYLIPELETYEGMQRRINTCCRKIAEENQALVAPVGEAFLKIRIGKPNLNLYRDNLHPNSAGTYVAACVFFTTLFGQSLEGAYIPDDVEEAAAIYIQHMVSSG